MSINSPLFSIILILLLFIAFNLIVAIIDYHRLKKARKKYY